METNWPATINPPPLAKFSAVDTVDLSEAEAAISGIFCAHRMTPLERRAAGFHAVHNTARFDGFSVNHLSYGAAVQIDPGTFNNFFLLIVPTTGRTEVLCAGKRVEAAHGTASLLSPTLPSVATWHAGAGNLIILIERTMLERHLTATIDRCVERVEFSPIVPLADGIGEAIGVQALLMQQLAESITCRSTARLVQRKLCDALIGLLIAGVSNNYSDYIHRPSGLPAPAHVKRVEDFIRGNPDQDISIPELAAVAGVSLRTLQEGFRRFRGLTLTEAVREVRLAQWRTLLESARAGARAGDLALLAGLTHYGRATEAYRRRYGENPSETLRRHS